MKVIYNSANEDRRVWRAKAWDEPCAPTVEVSFEKPNSLFSREGRIEINWSCCGGVSPAKAIEFAEMLKEALSVSAVWESELEFGKDPL